MNRNLHNLYYVKYDARFEKWGGALESPHFLTC